MSFNVHLFNQTDHDLPLTVEWISKCASEIYADYRSPIVDLNVVCLGDDEHTSLNIKHLNHDTSTDIITFEPLSELEPVAEIYINVDRAMDNANAFEATSQEELRRLVIHGVLHLNGQGDKTPDEQKQMKSLEEKYLKRFM